MSKVTIVFSQVDYLVNNAGRSVFAPAMNTQLDAVRAVLELNVIGTLLPHMIQQHSGSIVVMSSVTGKQGSISSSIIQCSHNVQVYLACRLMEQASMHSR